MPVSSSSSRNLQGDELLRTGEPRPGERGDELSLPLGVIFAEPILDPFEGAQQRGRGLLLHERSTVRDDSRKLPRDAPRSSVDPPGDRSVVARADDAVARVRSRQLQKVRTRIEDQSLLVEVRPHQ